MVSPWKIVQLSLNHLKDLILKKHQKKLQSLVRNAKRGKLLLLKEQRYYSPEELYILEQTFKQKPIYKNSEVSAAKIGSQAMELLQKHKNDGDMYYHDMDAGELKKTIYKASEKIGFGLTDNTWKNVDDETDIDILRVLSIIANQKNDSQNFWEWRYFFFENKWIWEHFNPTNEIENKASKETP